MMIIAFIKYYVLADEVRGPPVWFPWATWWGCGFLLPTVPWCLPAASLGGGCLFQASGGALCFVQDPPASVQAQTQFTDAVGFQSRREAGWLLLFPWIESKKLNKGRRPLCGSQTTWGVKMNRSSPSSCFSGAMLRAVWVQNYLTSTHIPPPPTKKPYSLVTEKW